jgi:hypothetical protein
MTDPLDQPEPDNEWGLVFPFTACTSQGGPYDDAAFVAGVHLGHIDHALAIGAITNAARFEFTVPTELVKQLELCGMARGYPTLVAREVEATEDYDAMPEWTFVTFLREGAQP